MSEYHREYQCTEDRGERWKTEMQQIFTLPGACWDRLATAADGTHPTGMHSCRRCQQFIIGHL